MANQLIKITLQYPFDSTNLLPPWELEFGPPQCLQAGGHVAVLAADGHNDLSNVDPSHSTLRLTKRTTHTCLEPAYSVCVCVCVCVYACVWCMMGHLLHAVPSCSPQQDKYTPETAPHVHRCTQTHAHMHTPSHPPTHPHPYLSAPAHDNILLILSMWKGWSLILMWNWSFPACLTIYLLQQMRPASRASLDSCSCSLETRCTH